MCSEIDSAEVSDSTIVERSPFPGLSVTSEAHDGEDAGNGGVPEEYREKPGS